ncbi:MAG: SHOCT domain-containing protein [Geminicoccaceae bacterium]
MNDTPSVTCPNCSASNPVGAKFCSACAKPLAPGAMPPPPQPQYQPSPQFQVPISGSGLTGGAEEMRQVQGTPDAVFDQILGIVQASGGEVREQHKGQMISAIIPWKDFWITGGNKFQYKTNVTLEPLGTDQTVVRIRPNIEISSTMVNLIAGIVILIIIVQYNLTLAFVFWPLMFLHIGIWFWSFKWRGSKGVAESILSKLNVGIIGQPASQQSSPPPSTKSQHSTAADATEGDIMKKIQKLAELRDAGAITADEFEAKKAELLSRI